MIFIVMADWNQIDGKPCDEAYRMDIDNWDVRLFSTPEEYDQKFSKQPWYSIGTDHCLWEGKIARKRGRTEEWVIRINTLEDLIAWLKRNPDYYLRAPFNLEPYPTMGRKE